MSYFYSVHNSQGFYNCDEIIVVDQPILIHVDFLHNVEDHAVQRVIGSAAMIMTERLFFKIIWTGKAIAIGVKTFKDIFELLVS